MKASRETKPQHRHIALVLRLVSAAMLFWALADHPYGYFTLLRFVVTAVAVYSAVLAYNQQNEGWTWIFGAIAVLFNPIIPIYLTREVWVVIDVIVGAIMLISLFFLKRNSSNRQPEQNG